MAQTWSYTLLDVVHLPHGMGGSSGYHANKAILVSAVGPASSVEAGAVMDVSDDLEHVAFGFPSGNPTAADCKWKHDCLIASGNSGADLKVVTWDISGAAVAPADTALNGVEQRFMLLGWD